MNKKYLLFLILLISLLTIWVGISFAQDFTRMPRPNYENTNTLRAPKNPLYPNSFKKVPNRKPKNTIGSSIASLPIRFYQEFISPTDGSRCTHHPSCSAYSLLAIKKHGGFTGFLLTFDRLLHESNEARFSPVIKVGPLTKVYDPVENNTFWWRDKEKK